MNHQVLGGGGYPDLSGSTTKKKLFYVRLPLHILMILMVTVHTHYKICIYNTHMPYIALLYSWFHENGIFILDS